MPGHENFIIHIRHNKLTSTDGSYHHGTVLPRDLSCAVALFLEKLIIYRGEGFEERNASRTMLDSLIHRQSQNDWEIFSKWKTVLEQER